MLYLSDKNYADVIDAFSYTSTYLDELLNIDNPSFPTNGNSDIQDRTEHNFIENFTS